MIGPHVFGDGRLGCWFMGNADLRDRLQRVRSLGVTDAFLPTSATLADKRSVRDAGLFPALRQTPPGGMLPAGYALAGVAACTRLDLTVLEQNVEGVPDPELETFLRRDVAEIRRRRRLLRLRINVVPWKGAYLPTDLFASDAQLYVIVQNYLGNMDARVAEDEIVRDLVDHGIPPAKVSVMYGAHVGRPRVASLPDIRFRGSIYQDDLLADAGLI